MTENGLLDEMARAYQAWMPRKLREWYSPEELRELARKEMQPQAEHVGNAEFGEGFRDYVEGLGGPDLADPLEWVNKRVEFTDGNWCVCGIRFLGMDPAKPFVSVAATSVPSELAALEPYAEQLHREYAAFVPLAIRFELPDAPENADVDQWVVAGLVSDLREYPRRPQTARMQLVRAEPDEVVAYADEVLANVVKANPDVNDWTEAATLDRLHNCAETGALRAIEIDGQRSGIIAAARDDAHGMRGFQVYEFLLDDHARGRGHAPAIMQLLCDELPAEDGDTLWGTIHAGNAPSIGNALAVGREKIAAHVWVARRGEL